MNVGRKPRTGLRRWWIAASAVLTLAAAGMLVAPLTGLVAQPAETPPPTLVVLARSDVPADALGAGPVAAVFGAPLLVTPPTRLAEEAAAALTAVGPDLVVLAGGTAALSEQVEAEVAALGFTTRRIAGANRHDTAAQLAGLLAEFGVGRPVLTGRPVTDAVIPGLNAERVGGMTAQELLASGTPGAPGNDGEDGEDGQPGPPGLDLGEQVIVVPATGNATADGTALRGAVDQIVASGAPGVVMLGAGTYDVGDDPLTITGSVVLQGAGRSVTAIVGTPPGTGTAIATTSGALVDIITGAGDDGIVVEVRDLSLHAASRGLTTTSVTLLARGPATVVRVHNVHATLATDRVGAVFAYVFRAVVGADLTLVEIHADLPSAPNATSGTRRGVVGSGSGGVPTVRVVGSHSAGVLSETGTQVNVRDSTVTAASNGQALAATTGGTLRVASTLVDGSATASGGTLTCVGTFNANYAPLNAACQ